MGVRYDIQSAEDPFEIYNVVLDPKQAENLAEEPTKAMRELQVRLKATALQSRRPLPDAPRPYDHQAMPAVADSANPRPGLAWRSYQGEFPWVPNFALLTSNGNGTTDSIDAHLLGRSKASGLYFEGFLRVPTDGDYTFALTTNGGAVMRLHEATVIDADYAYESGTLAAATVRLQAGLHHIRLHYLRSSESSPQLDLKWSGPGFASQQLPANALAHRPE